MNKINIHDLDFSNTNRYDIIRDKYNRIDDNGINHGRSIYYDKIDNIYYKLFHKEYVRRSNFEMAIQRNSLMI